MNAAMDNNDYERKDVDVRALFIIAFLLLLSGIAIFIVVALMLPTTSCCECARNCIT